MTINADWSDDTIPYSLSDVSCASSADEASDDTILYPDVSYMHESLADDDSLQSSDDVATLNPATAKDKRATLTGSYIIVFALNISYTISSSI